MANLIKGLRRKPTERRSGDRAVQQHDGIRRVANYKGYGHRAWLLQFFHRVRRRTKHRNCKCDLSVTFRVTLKFVLCAGPRRNYRSNYALHETCASRGADGCDKRRVHVLRICRTVPFQWHYCANCVRLDAGVVLVIVNCFIVR